MLTGLTREVRWRDAAESPPPTVGWVLVAQAPAANMETAVCRPAYWDGRDFLDAVGLVPMRTVTHWMSYPTLPPEKEMRRVFRDLLGDADTMEAS